MRTFGLLKSILVVSASAVCSLAVATGFYGNQSDIKWKTAGSDHFQFYYPAEYSSHASKVSAYAEAVYDSVVSRYHKPLPSRVNVSLSNALYSNGSAVPSENALNLWLTNWDFKIRSSHGWLSDVVTHEFSHLVSIESGSKVRPNIYGLQFSYSDYYNEKITSDFVSMVPFTLQPLWLAEGTAQYESSRMGFDGWDSHRDMLLRTAALNDSLLSLEYMHDFSDNSLFAELGPYTQGFALVLYIDKHYGEDAVPKIWNNLAKFNRMTLDGAIKEVLGISEQELYDNWKKEITEQYKALKDSLGELVEGTKLTEASFWQDFPVVAGKHLYGISNFGGPWFDGSVFKMPLEADTVKADSTTATAVDSAKTVATKDSAAADSAKVEIGDAIIESSSESDSTKDSSTIINISDYARSGFKAKKPWFDKGIDVFQDSVQGPILAYISYQNRDKDGHAHFDVAISDTNKNELTLTYLVDAVYPAIDKQGSTIAFVRREPYSTRFALSKVPFPKDLKDYTAEDPVDIFVPDSQYTYYNIYSPKFSPDGKRIAFSYFDNKVRGIAVIDSDGKNFKVVSNSEFDERDVNWIDDDKIIFASNRNGIFNLIEKSLSTGIEHPLTNVLGGAFTPVLNGDTIYYTNYDKDGFSLYKLAYSIFVPATADTTISFAERDSVIHIVDTTWQNCNAASWQDTSANSLIKQDSAAIDSLLLIQKDCVSIPNIATRDSIIKVQDTIRTITTKEGSKEIVLKGTLNKRIEKQLDLPELEFAGIEQNYKPIPNVPMFVPMIALTESAPDLTVFGDGQMKVKAGLAVLLSDPLKKNNLQLGLLLELGSGLLERAGQFFPGAEKEFFVSWENRSTPLDLSLAYSYANSTSKDTVRYEDVKAHGGDSLGISNYAVSTQSIVATAGYSIFKTIDTLQVAAGYNWSNFNLYEDYFDWTYQKQLVASAALGLYGEHGDETGISGQGNGLTLYYQYSKNDLYRPGTFAESFVVTESGKIEPIYRKYDIHEIGLNLYGSLQSPWTGARLAAGGKISGIINWSSKTKEDTLDSYYNKPLFLEGYPYLRSSEDYTLAGTRTAMAEVHYLFPIYDDWRKTAWIFSTRSLYFDVFAQIGAAWQGDWIDTDKWTDHRFWDRSVGLNFRMSNKLFYSVPLDISLTFARGLSRIGENKDLTGGYKVKPIDIPLLPNAISPTRIKFSIGMGFNNTWQ
ncbi:MAG: hypothetical protein MJY85_07985 [Fibrobacter sp.]|nr:hypothetical protein [Fibrobacter sp.]